MASVLKSLSKSLIIEVVAVTYGQNDILKCFINCMKAQYCHFWKLRIIHDGPGEKFENLKKELIDQSYIEESPDPAKDRAIVFECSDQRYDDWGHSLREYALDNPIFNSDYTILTNADNYYVPDLVNELGKSAIRHQNPDIMYWDCVHNHGCNPHFDRQNEYALCNSELAESRIDMGSAAIKTHIARNIGFRNKRNEADWDYFSECISYIDKIDGGVLKIPKILLVHN